MKPVGPDTHPQAELVQLQLLRQASVARRFGRARSLTQSTIQLARRAIQRARPGLTPAEVLLAFVEIHYGSVLASHLQADLRRRQG